MAKSFSAPPLDFKMLDDNGYVTSVWKQWFADTFQTLDALASEAGVQLPVLTTSERDSNDVIDQNNIPAGLTIFNSTTAKAQTYDGTMWQDLF